MTMHRLTLAYLGWAFFAKRIVGAIAAILVLLLSWRCIAEHREHVRLEQLADSLDRATDSLHQANARFEFQAALNEGIAKAAVHVADSLHAITEQIPQLLERTAAWLPLPRPQIVGDTVHLPGDSSAHVVDRPVAQWMAAADQAITYYRTVIQDTIRPAWNALSTERDSLRSAVRAFGLANVNLDSLATNRWIEIKGLRARLLTQQSPSSMRPTATYAGLLVGGVAANRWLGIDRDPGGYVDSWRTPDKLTHAAVGALLSTTAIDMGVKPKWAIALTCAGAAGFEWSQGFISRKDIYAGCGGAIAGAGLRWTARKLVGLTR